MHRKQVMKTKFLLLHGVNLNRLGQRDPLHYGSLSLRALETLCEKEAIKYGFEIISYQSNHEGDLVDKIQALSLACSGIIINAGAYTHYSYALHDALLDAALPAVEVHLSAVEEREPWRQHSVLAPACIAVIAGKKEQGYKEAILTLVRHLDACK